jgi:hypothetical protein
VLVAEINETLAVIRDRLEQVLQSIQSQTEPWVLLGNAAVAEGGELRDESNKIIISVVGLQADASTSGRSAPSLGKDDRYYTGYPPLHVNLYVMIAANFSDVNYEAGLARLSAVISFFQRSPVLTRANTPSLPDGMDQLVIEFASLDFAQLSHLLTATGRRYVPMVFYRLRRLSFSGAVAAVAPPIKASSPDVLPGPR